MDPMVSLQMVVEMALSDAHRFGPPAPQLVSAESVVWRSGALGCPAPDMAYAQALVPGYRVQLRVGERELHYHAGRSGKPTLCPADRVQAPLPDAK